MAKYAWLASSIYRANPLRLFLQALPICHKHDYDAAEAFRLGLFDLHLKPDELTRYCSRKQLTKLQRSLNPPALVPLIRNKAMFYRFSRAHQVPVPELYALFFHAAPGWTYKNPVVTQSGAWEAFFEKEAPAEFAVKPIEASFGSGFNIYRRQDDRLVDPLGASYTAKEIRRHLCASHGRSGFIIQERLRNHCELLRLTGANGLQTARLTTLLDETGACRIIHAHFKLIAGDNLIDNFDHGTSGNLQARIDLAHGHLYNPVTASPGVPGIQPVEKHPDTGHTIEGFELPCWSEACQLVKQIAPLFLPLRTIGWDVALTPDGPVIVEGNAWWNPPNQHGNLETIVAQLSNASRYGAPACETQPLSS